MPVWGRSGVNGVQFTRRQWKAASIVSSPDRQTFCAIVRHVQLRWGKGWLVCLLAQEGLKYTCRKLSVHTVTVPRWKVGRLGLTLLWHGTKDL